MLQIGLLIIAGGVIFQGIRALSGKEPEGKETSKPVAIITTVVGVLLAIFALFLPTLLNAYIFS